ncbi:MAG: chorismate synthase [Bacillaceae bacterium]
MRYLTAGESHGPQLTAIIEGVPAGLTLLEEKINIELQRRQKGYGRGRRMQIEKDEVKILSGVRHGVTLGSPITLAVTNRDYAHWEKIMNPQPIEDETYEGKRKVSRPRPGHADLNGAIKYGHRDMRNVLERSSARETTVRVAVGAVAKILLEELGVQIAGHVIELGNVKSKATYKSIEELQTQTEASPVRCLDKEAEGLMIKAIDEAKENGDSIGGVVEVIAKGMPAGIGSYVHYDRKLDGKLASAMVSINAFKGVEFGMGFEMAQKPGSEVHDEIGWSEEEGFYRLTNHAGGLEGGMTTGMPIVVRGVMKPIPTLYKPLQSVDIDSKELFAATIERSDSCAVPAASVVAESVIAWELANALVEHFQSDQLDRMKNEIEQYRAYTRGF